MRMKRIHQAEPKREIPLCRIRSSRSEKVQTAREILYNSRGNDQQNFLVEPKQNILKMCHFPRIERKFRWNQYQKVLILIPRIILKRRYFV